MAWDGFGFGVRPPALYAQADQGIRTHASRRIHLIPTGEPVWPEDEAREVQEGGPKASVSSESVALDTLKRRVHLALPEAIPVQNIDPERIGDSTHRFTYASFAIPVSFAADDPIIPRRLAISLSVSSVTSTGDLRPGGDQPIAIYLHPGESVTVNKQHLLTVGLDLGKLLKIAQLPDFVTVRAGGEVNRTKLHPRIQAEGRYRHEFGWRVADGRIVYGFCPSVVVQLPARQGWILDTNMHVEVRRSMMMGLLHKTYGRSATPQRYRYEAGGRRLTALSDHRSLGIDFTAYEMRSLQAALEGQKGQKGPQHQEETPRSSEPANSLPTVQPRAEVIDLPRASSGEAVEIEGANLEVYGEVLKSWAARAAMLEEEWNERLRAHRDDREK